MTGPPDSALLAKVADRTEFELRVLYRGHAGIDAPSERVDGRWAVEFGRHDARHPSPRRATRRAPRRAGFPLSQYADTCDEGVSDVSAVTLEIRLGAERHHLENLWARGFPDESTPTIDTLQHAQLDDLAYFVDVCAGSAQAIR